MSDKLQKCGVLVALMAVVLGCQPEPDQRLLLDELVVSTNYDTDADFTTYATYAIPTDTIGFFSNAISDTILVQDEPYDFPRPVLTRIRQNLNARGFSEVDRSENPDIGINVTLANDFNVFQQVVYPGGYYGGYYGYGGWYSYPYVNTYAYNTGALIVEIVDLKNKTPDNKVKVVWNAYMGDIYSAIKTVEQTQQAIDQSFDQSPYLQH